MLLLLQSIQARHQDRHGKEDSNHDHEEEEGLVVGVIGGEFSHNRHLVRHVVEDLLADTIAEAAKPVRVVDHYKHIVVHLVLRQEHRVARFPFVDLLIHNAFFADEVALLHLAKGHPLSASLNVAKVVFLLVKEEQVEVGVGDQAKLARLHGSPHRDIVLGLGDISPQVVIVEAFTRQAELGEGACWDLCIRSSRHITLEG